MRRLIVLLATLALFISLPGAWSNADTQDDAGSGRDAPGTPSPDVAVESGVAYSGALEEGDMHDWYAFEALAGAVGEVRVAGNFGCWEVAGGDGVALGHQCAYAPYAEREPLVVTVPSAGTWYFHYQNVPMDAYRFSVGVDEPAAAPVAGPAPPDSDSGAQDDAGSGRDAPNAPIDRVRIAPGQVYHAALADGDESDWYAFEATAGSSLQAKASGIGCLAITDAAGVEMDSSCTLAYAYTSKASATATATGTYFLHFSFFVPQDYAFSLGVGASAPEPFVPAERPRQDDAGSGDDAPNERLDGVRIVGGQVYQGSLDTPLTDDDEDWYAFEAKAGDVIEARATMLLGCFSLHDAAGVELDSGCVDAAGRPTVASGTAPADGLYFLRVYYLEPQDYWFSIGVNEPAPVPPAWAFSAPAPSVFLPAPPAEAWVRAAATGTPVTLAIAGEPVRIALRENGALLGHGLVVRDEAGAPVDVSGVRFLAGVVDGEPGSWVRVTVWEENLLGHVSRPSEGLYTLGTRVDGTVVAMAEARLRALLPRDVRPHETEAPRAGPAGGLGGCTQATPTRAANPLGLALGWPERTFDVAFAVDNEFVSYHGADWAAVSLAYVNTIDGLYASTIDLRLSVVDLHAHAAGAIPGATTADLLETLSAHYAVSHGGIARENVNLFSGKLLTGAVGQANCVGGAGNPEIAYTVGQATDAGASNLLGLRFFADTNVKIAAHEMAHILSAHHHYASCTERAPHHDTQDAFGLCTLLINDIGLASLQMSAANRLVTRGWSEHANL